MENSGSMFLLFGSIAGVYSFARLVVGDISSFFNKTNLAIEFDAQNDVKQWFVGPPYLNNTVARRVVTVNVRNKGGKPARDCEAYIEVNNGRNKITLPLHWADTQYNALSTSIERVEISKIPRRLDVVFSQEGQSINGCCVASAQALATGPQRDQFFLSEGEYKVRIYVNYNSGKSVARKFVIQSPSNWVGLRMRIA